MEKIKCQNLLYIMNEDMVKYFLVIKKSIIVWKDHEILYLYYNLPIFWFLIKYIFIIYKFFIL